MQSIVQRRGSVPFPTHTGDRVYMRRFTKREGLPFDLRRWQPTVDAMLDGIDVAGPVFLMVDQATVRPGDTHRRPGLHVDGYWLELPGVHGGGGGRHGGAPGRWDTPRPTWHHCDFTAPEALILASDVAASRAFVGEWDGVARDGGDCGHVNTSGMLEVPLEAGIAYAGNVAMLHESLPVAAACARTLVRLSAPGWSPELQ